MPSTRTVALSLTAAGVLLVAGGCGDPVGRTIGAAVSLESGDIVLPTFVPDGLRVTSVSQDDYKPPWGDLRVAVYGDPGQDDPVAGPMLAGVYEYQEADEDYLPPDETGSLFDALDADVCPGDEDAYERTKLDGLSARRATIDGRHWVCWDDRRSLPDGDYCSECVDQLAVVGRGVSADAVWQAAKAASVDKKNVVRIPGDALPTDVEYVDSADLDANSDSFTWTDEAAGAELRLSVSSEAGQALAGRALLGGEPAAIRGGQGMIRRNGQDTLLLWQEEHLLLSVTAHGVTRRDVKRFVEDLAPVSEDQAGDRMRRLYQRMLHYPAELMVAPRERVALATQIDGTRFVLGVRGDAEQGFRVRGYVLLPGTGLEASSAIELRPSDDADPISFESGSWLSDRRLRVGVADRDVAEVEVFYKDYLTKDVPVGEPMPDGSRFFAAWLPQDERPRRLFAYDADGDVLVEGPVSSF